MSSCYKKMCLELFQNKCFLCSMFISKTYIEIVGNNPSLTSAKSNSTLKYISEGQPSPLEQAFGIELGLSHYLF